MSTRMQPVLVLGFADATEDVERPVVQSHLGEGVPSEEQVTGLAVVAASYLVFIMYCTVYLY